VSLPKSMNVERASQPLRIAIAYSRSPFPMMRGDQLTVGHLLSYLSARGHQVDLFTLATDGVMGESQKEWLANACRQVRMYPHGKIAKIAGIVRGLFLGVPMQVGCFTSDKLIRDVRNAIRDGEYDLVYIYYIRSAEVFRGQIAFRKENRDKESTTVSILAMQLSQILNTRRMYENESHPLWRLVYLLELKLLRRYEARVWRRFNRVALIGHRDLEAIRAECRRQSLEEINNWIYSAHGTDVERFRSARSDEVVSGRIVFSGSMAYRPNVQAVLWFTENCWPQIKRRYPSAEFVIQGRDPLPEVLELKKQPGITVTGTVADVGAIIRSATVCVNPMQAAGGMQNKLIEYLASNKAVVATSIANEGIDAVPGKHLIIANSPDEFAAAVSTLLEDEARRDALGHAGRAFVCANWTWEVHFAELEREFYRAVRGSESVAVEIDGEASGMLA